MESEINENNQNSFEFKPQEDLTKKKEAENLGNIGIEGMDDDNAGHSRISLYNPNNESDKKELEKKKENLSNDTEIGADAVSSDILHEIASFDTDRDMYPLLNMRTSCFMKLSPQKILTFSRSYLDNSLLRLSTADNIECALEIYKNLLYYSKERDGSATSSKIYVKNFLRACLEAGDELKNEAYVQIRKQLNGNPDQSKLMLGWKLLAIVSSMFVPPNKTIYNMMMNFLFEIVHQENIDDQILKHANYIFVRMVKTKESPRRVLPSDTEIDCIELLRPIPIKVTLYSGKEETCFVESYSTMADIKEEILRKIDMHLDRTIFFSGYEICNKKGKIEERYIDDDEKVCEIMALWEKEEKKYRKKEKINEINFKLYLRLSTFIDYDPKVDKEFLSFTYHQTKYDVITGKHKLTADQIATLASLQLLDKYGSDLNAATKAVSTSISQFVPDIYYDEIKNESEIVQFILDKYNKISMSKKDEAKENYLNELKQAKIPTYESNQFDAEFNLQKSGINDDDLPIECVIGIRPDGIVILDRDRNQKCFYSYDTILHWGISQTDFILTLDINDANRRVCFTTSQTKVMQNMIEIYCNLIIGKTVKDIKEIFMKRGKKFAAIYSGGSRSGSVYKKTKTFDTAKNETQLDLDNSINNSENLIEENHQNGFEDEDTGRKMEA